MIKVDKNEIIKIVKYLFSAGSSFVIDLVLFTIFECLFKNILSTSLNIFISTFIARLLSSLYNYVINSRIVFKSKNTNSIIGYYILVIIQMVISATLVSIVNRHIEQNATIIKFCIDILIFIVNYIVQRNIIFREKG